MARMAEKMPVNPIKLQEVLKKYGISQRTACKDLGINQSTFNQTCKKGYIPGHTEDDWMQYRLKIEQYLYGCGVLVELIEQIWEPTSERGPMPDKRIKQRDYIDWEVEMVTHETMKHFKIFRNPFLADIQSKKDVYLSQQHRYVKEAMLDAAYNGGFVAVVGEVGSGKTVMRELVFDQILRDDRVTIIFPQAINKKRMTSYHIAEAIIRDVAVEVTSPASQELQGGLVKKLLLERFKAGRRFVLVLEEAHDMRLATIKELKRFLEMRDGLSPILGIILIGQPELREKFDERRSYDIREVIRRCVIADLEPFSEYDMEKYLTLKFKRIGSDLGKVISPDGLKALAERLIIRDRYGKLVESRIYPLLVNLYSSKAMNLAAEMGEELVNAEVVAAI